jgi:hypothetical protein
MRPVVEGMGLDWKSQYVKLVADLERFSVVEITTVASDGKNREMVCLPLRRLFGWLMTISPNKVKPVLRQKIIQYQRECDDVLWKYWSKQMQLHEPGPLLALAREQLGNGQCSLDATFLLQWLLSNQVDSEGVDITVRQLAEETGVSKSSVARILVKLESLGLLDWDHSGRVRLKKNVLDKALGRIKRVGLH